MKIDKTLEREFANIYGLNGVYWNYIELLVLTENLELLEEDSKSVIRDLVRIIDSSRHSDTVRRVSSFGYLDKVMDEIESNLFACGDAENKKIYVRSVLMLFEPYHKAQRNHFSGHPIESSSYEECILQQAKKTKENLGDYLKNYEFYICSAAILYVTFRRFAKGLYALLLIHGLNLIELQKDCGVYILPVNEDEYFDCTTHKYTQQEPSECFKFSEYEQQCYDKAIEAGMAIREEGGYRWRYITERGRKASLGYFIKKVHDPKGNKAIPYEALQKLWNERRLDSAINQMLNASKEQKWRKGIDELLR